MSLGSSKHTQSSFATCFSLLFSRPFQTHCAIKIKQHELLPHQAYFNAKSRIANKHTQQPQQPNGLIAHCGLFGIMRISGCWRITGHAAYSVHNRTRNKVVEIKVIITYQCDFGRVHDVRERFLTHLVRTAIYDGCDVLLFYWSFPFIDVKQSLIVFPCQCCS